MEAESKLLDDFLSVAETGYAQPTAHCLKTTVTDSALSVEMIKLSNTLGLHCCFDWGMEGLLVKFRDHEDLALFKIAYPNSEVFINS